MPSCSSVPWSWTDDSGRREMRSTPKRQLRSRLRNGALAGVLATVVEGASLRLLTGDGRKPVFLPEEMVQRMAGRFGYLASDNAARRIGTVLRAGYGPTWGLAWAVVRHERASRHLSNTVALGFVIWGFELMVLPRVQATPPLRRWPRADIALDLVNCLAFAATYTGVIALLDGRGQPANR